MRFQMTMSGCPTQFASKLRVGITGRFLWSNALPVRLFVFSAAGLEFAVAALGRSQRERVSRFITSEETGDLVLKINNYTLEEGETQICKLYMIQMYTCIYTYALCVCRYVFMYVYVCVRGRACVCVGLTRVGARDEQLCPRRG